MLLIVLAVCLLELFIAMCLSFFSAWVEQEESILTCLKYGLLAFFIAMPLSTIGTWLIMFLIYAVSLV